MILFRYALALAVIALVVAIPYVAESYPQGAPAGFAGDTVDPFSGVITCAVDGCHNSYGLNSGSGSVSIQAPASVMAGETVAITVTVDNQTAPAPGSTIRQGFEATVRDPAMDGPFVGTLSISDATNTRTPFGSTSYVTHTQTGTAQTSWTFNWTAPTSDYPPTVIVYAAGNAANGGDLPSEPGNSAAGDHIYSTTASISIMPVAAEPQPEEVGLSLGQPEPNPIHDRGRVMLGLERPASISLTIVDGLGRTLRTVAERALPAGETPIGFDASGLAPGTYFLVAETPSGRQTQPFRVVR